ncbi:hypothetical protein HanIR_Chr08g0356731 [Helianthus annuus]|nr:hypothetical protein HanIR_Chr08g0356731 [Helianthus annuus]
MIFEELSLFPKINKPFVFLYPHTGQNFQILLRRTFLCFPSLRQVIKTIWDGI